MPKSQQQKKAAAKVKRKRRKALARTLKPPPKDTQSGLRLPLSKTHLIRSVMADLGRPLPSKIGQLNRAIGKLINENIITESGDFVLSHPIVAKWLSEITR